MAIHQPTTKEGIYFITFTCHQWLALFELSDGYCSVYNFFDVMQKNGHTVLGYVIMPNHLHMLLHYRTGKQSLNTIIGNGKRFMAYDIVDKLKQKEQNETLLQLQKGVQAKDRSRGKKHEVWIDSFDVKECRTEKFLLQKLVYMHMNPISGKWKLCTTILDYLHSSAPFYFNGRQQLLR